MDNSRVAQVQVTFVTSWLWWMTVPHILFRRFERVEISWAELASWTRSAALVVRIGAAVAFGFVQFCGAMVLVIQRVPAVLIAKRAGVGVCLMAAPVLWPLLFGCVLWAHSVMLKIIV